MARDAAYLEAEKKIEEALKSGATELDLSNMKLTELPESIGQLTQLRKLDLGHRQSYSNNKDDEKNKLTSLPESLGQLTQLQELIIADNQFTELPESLEKLTQLQKLDLSHNPLRVLSESLISLTQLQSLFLKGITFVEFPSNLWKLSNLKTLSLFDMQLTSLPPEIAQLIHLERLHLGPNPLTSLPAEIIQLKNLKHLSLGQISFSKLPAEIWQLTNLQSLYLHRCELTSLPAEVGQLINLREINLFHNLLTDLPLEITQLEHLEIVNLNNNPLNLELAEAYKQGVDAVKLYLRAGAVVPIYEAKLILIGEGEVGKTCLMDALLGKEWQEHPSTHGIEIQQIKVSYPKEEKKTPFNQSEKIITLNGWDFGGQRVYRPTHQLFFSAPAVYLVVWKPREGPQQGFVKEWIQLVKRREPSAKMIVVATHGGPQQRQPDIDRQELWDLFGKETIIDFCFVDSKPDKNGERKGIEELKEAIARVAATLPEVGRSVPKSFADVRAALQATGAPYLRLDEVLAICRTHDMDDEIARLFITISHRLGHLTHYENDPTLRDIVILRPDWLATAMSYVLDDRETRKANGLVKFSRLSQLWSDPSRPAETRYPKDLHEIFLRLMERFDLSYRVAGLSKNEGIDPISLIAQLVPDTTPKEEDFEKAWLLELAPGDIQQTQICRIVDAQNGQSANAEGLFFQLIVRLHRYSLGRVNYPESVHWQRGLVIDADYNGRALLRHIGNDVHITVRAAYPQGFLNALTDEVKYLVESFWEGLRCDVTVPCLNPAPCNGLFEVRKLIENKKRGRPEQPCPICNEWQDIDKLLLNASAAQPAPAGELLASQRVLTQLNDLRQILIKQHTIEIGRFDSLDARQKELLSKAETSYNNLIKVFIDEAKEGPRLFSLVPVNRSGFNPKQWISAKFKLILWCEHSRWPLPILNGKDSDKGVYELELTREWFKKAAPVLKAVTSTLSLVLPIASSAVKLVMDESAYRAIENELDFGKDVIDDVLGGAEKTELFTDAGDSVDLPHGTTIRAENAALRELHALLKAKDPGFGGLVRVMNKRQEFLWVHEKFAGEY
jgi:Leucine-rich repeat (LRR) protein